MTSEDILTIAGFKRYDDGLWRAHAIGDGSVNGILELFDVARIEDNGDITIKRKVKLAGSLDFITIECKLDDI